MAGNVYRIPITETRFAKDVFCQNKLVSLCFTGWRAERGDLCRPAAFCDCLFALICAEEEGDNLRTRAGIVRHELAAIALYDFLSKRPVHRGKRVARNGIGVREAGHQLLQGDRLGRSVAEQKRDGLSAGAFAVWRECVPRCAGGDALAERPADGLGVVAAFGDIAHVHGVVHHGRTGGAPQEGDDLRSGAVAVRGKEIAAHATGNTVLHRPFDGVK